MCPATAVPGCESIGVQLTRRRRVCSTAARVYGTVLLTGAPLETHSHTVRIHARSHRRAGCRARWAGKVRRAVPCSFNYRRLARVCMWPEFQIARMVLNVTCLGRTKRNRANCLLHQFTGRVTEIEDRARLDGPVRGNDDITAGISGTYAPCHPHFPVFGEQPNRAQFTASRGYAPPGPSGRRRRWGSARATGRAAGPTGRPPRPGRR